MTGAIERQRLGCSRMLCTVAHCEPSRKPVPKPNYAFEKRQRELEKKRKKEEKAQRKQSRADVPPEATEPGEAGAPAPGDTLAPSPPSPERA